MLKFSVVPRGCICLVDGRRADTECDVFLLSLDFSILLNWVLRIANSIRLNTCVHETNTHE